MAVGSAPISEESSHDTVSSESQGELGVKATSRKECGADHPEPSGASAPVVPVVLCEDQETTGEEENWMVELARVCVAHLPPDHPCLGYIKGQGLDLGAPDDFDKFTGNPSPLGGRRWYLSVTVKGRKGEFLVDTGASHSLVSKKFFDLLPNLHENPTKGVNARTADGSRMQTYGRTFLPVSIVGKEFVLSPIIAEMNDDGIIGLDFCALFGAMLDPVKGVLKIAQPYGVKAQCVLRTISSIASVVQRVKIPAGTTCDVLCSSVNGWRGETAVFEPDRMILSKHGLESVDTLVGNAAWSVVPISNPTLDTVYLERGTRVGKMALVDAVTSQVTCNTVIEQPDRELSDPLNVLLSECCLADREQRRETVNLLKKYSKAFMVKGEPVGRTDRVLHTIDTGDNKPFKIPYRRLPLKKKTICEEEIEEQLKLDVIVPSTSPWSSPVHMTTKKDGTIRFCIDYRKLNGMTKKNSYPLPRIDETLDSLGGNQFFSTLDLKSGYWQVGMHPDDMEKTAFSSHMGLFQYKVMPFGLCNAPATFECMMETLLSDLLWKKCLVYLDDVIIFGKTFEECLANLDEVIGRIHANGLKLNVKKCKLFQRSITYLGRVISPEGIKADPAKLEAVSGWEKPRSPKDVRSFLGFCSYYRDFIPGYSRVSYPMQVLSHWTPGSRKESFPWGKEQDDSFRAVKRLFTETPVLRYPTATDHFILDTDASNESIGAALSQVQNGIEVPLAFASNTMNKAQRNYCTTKRELLAVVVYTKKFKHFLWGTDFTLRTDHSSLKWLLNFKDAEGMIGRWLAHLSEFGLEHSQIQHRAGIKHINADALSRKPVRKCSRQDCGDCGAHDAVVAGVRVPLENGLENVMEWSSETLRMFQGQDPVISRLLKLVPKGIKPVRPEISLDCREMRRFLAQWTELEVKNDILCRWRVNASNKRVLQVVIPTVLRRDIMYYCHGHYLSGHFGKSRSIERLKRRYYWPGMSGDLVRWIATCPDCCLNKPGPGMGKLPLTQELFGVRFARVAVDIISGFKTTPRGNTCMMVVTDYYTKYTRVFPLENHKAATCAEAFVRGWVLHLGVPLKMHSDQGREFESNLWTEMCHYLAICKTRTNPYRPQSDGMVERFNRTLIQVLKPLVNRQTDDWDEQCDYVVHAYNGTMHTTTGLSPNMLVFGEDLIMPADLVFGLVGTSPEAPCHVLFVESLRERFKDSYEMVRVELQKNAKWQKVGYDTGLKDRKFKVGDKVARLHEPLSSLKLTSNWDGPFVVTRVISESTVVIKSSIGRLYKSNVARLRPWMGREIPPVLGDLGIKELLPEVPVPIAEPIKTKRGPGRPRKLPDNKVHKGVKITKEVSPGEGLRGKRVKRLTKTSPAVTCPDSRSLNGEGTLRRSSRLKERGAVT